MWIVRQKGNNVDYEDISKEISKMPFYMVISDEFGHHLYKSLDEALIAIRDICYENDHGYIYQMCTGESYQDASTFLLYRYDKHGDEMYIADMKGGMFSYNDLVSDIYKL